jgi:hypothetical protein
MNRKIAVFISLVLAFAFASCAKRTNHPSPDIQMRADVYGLPWISYEANASVSKSATVKVDITGDSTRSRIKLHIENYRGPGVYTIPSGGNAASFKGDATTYEHIATSGRIVITSDTMYSSSLTQIKGTFEFLADIVPVNNGSFDVKLILD